MDADFLVDSILNRLSRWQADRSNIGKWDAQAEEVREFRIRILDDTDLRAAYLERLVELQADTFGNMSDGEFRHYLEQELLRDDPLIKPLAAEEAAKRWAEQEEWEHDRNRLVLAGVPGRMATPKLDSRYPGEVAPISCWSWREPHS